MCAFDRLGARQSALSSNHGGIYDDILQYLKL
jgi:hypothetical protein